MFKDREILASALALSFGIIVIFQQPANMFGLFAPKSFPYEWLLEGESTWPQLM